MMQIIEIVGFEKQQLEKIKEFFNTEFTTMPGTVSHEVNHNEESTIVKFNVENQEVKEEVLNKVANILTF